MKFPVRIILLFLLILFNLSAQSAIDSLQNLLPQLTGEEKVDALNELSALYGRGNVEQKLETAEEALQLAESIDYKFGMAQALNGIGHSYYYKREYRKSFPYFMQSAEIAKELDSLRFLGIVYTNHGNAYDGLRDRDSAYVYHIQAVTLLEQTDDVIALSNACTNVALEYWRWTQYAEALRYHRRALKLRQETDNLNMQAKSLNNIGVIYYRLGKLDLALDYYLQALAIHDSLGNAQNLVHITNNIGLIYRETEQYEKANENFRNALRIARKENHLSGIVYSLQSLGGTYELLGYPDSALALYQEGLALIEDNSLNQYTKVQLTNAAGRMYEEIGQLDSARIYFEKALQISNEMPYIIGEAEAKRNLALLYRQMKNYSRAEATLLDALTLVQEKGLRPHVRDYFYDLQNLYTETGNYKKALEYHKNYTVLKDSITNEATNEKIADLLIRFETEKKELENIRLRTEIDRETIFRNSFVIITILALLLVAMLYNRFRTQQSGHKLALEQKEKVELLNRELAEANITKDKFFSIISHDLKSPFTSILGYSELLKDEYQELSEDEKIEWIEMIHNSAKSSYELLENLLHWARTQRGQIKTVPETLNLRRIVQHSLILPEQIAKSKNIAIDIDIDNELEVFSDREMLLTIIRNLVNNAIKFTPENGNIEISAREAEKAIVTSVKDNGIGMTDEVSSNLFRLQTELTTTGTNEEKGTGLGLILCKEFVERQNGKLWFETEEQKGSTFSFSLPKSHYAE